MSYNCSLNPGKKPLRQTGFKNRGNGFPNTPREPKPGKMANGFNIPDPVKGQRNSTLAAKRQNPSPAEAERQKRYTLERAKYLKEHPVCQFPGCRSEAIEIHHSRGRVKELLWESRWFIATCREHHDRCERASGADLKMFKSMGWKLTRHRGGELDQEQEESE